MGTLSKSLHYPTCLHTPQKSVQYQLKKLGTNTGLGKRFVEEITIASRLDARERGPEAESPAPRGEPLPSHVENSRSPSRQQIKTGDEFCKECRQESPMPSKEPDKNSRYP